jgi:hypothetical protein
LKFQPDFQNLNPAIGLHRKGEHIVAKLLHAIVAYGPKIDLMEAAEPQLFMEMLTRRTTLSAGVVRNVQESEVEALIDLLQEGRPVHTGIAIFTPSVDLEGNLNINVRVDKRMLAALNAPRAFKGRIRNKENIGKTSQALAERWNEEHPHDPVQN